MSDLQPGHNYLRPVNISKVDSFEELRKEGFTPFSLGAMYVYVEIDRDLVQEFAKEQMPGRPEVHGTTMHFDRPVIGRCAEWNSILNIMDTPSFQWFKKWMIAQQYVHRARRRFYTSRHYIAPLLDPIRLDTKRLGSPTTLDIFAPAGMSGTIKPVTGVTKLEDTKQLVDLVVAPPDEDVIVLGRAALNIVEGS